MGDETKSSSSRIAAGVYNPFNFRRVTPTWKALETTGTARNFYTGAEQLTGRSFHRSLDILRVFASAEEFVTWSLPVQGEADFVTRISDEPQSGKAGTPFGYSVVTGGGIVNTQKFVEQTKLFFLGRNEFNNELFDAAKLEVTSEGVIYDRRITAAKIIFCQGHLGSENSFFDPQMWAPTKGELIHVSIPGLGIQEVINGPVYLAPLGDDLYVCGATFRPGKSDEEITEEGKTELLTKLRTMISLPLEVTGQFAGVRPAGRDRKPLVGLHTEHKQIAIFNGAGSKGVLLYPFLAKMLADHMESGVPLLTEVDIARFSKRKPRQ